MDNLISGSENEDESDMNIARRTRSHLTIGDFVPDDNLNFPDVDMNLYQNADSEVDTEYKTFLNQCYSRELGQDTNTDDNDPEYVYNDDIFSHGWRFDLNEWSKLQHDENEFEDATQDCQLGRDSEDKTQAVNLPTSSSKSPLKQARRKIDMFADPEFARILNQQLRQHIQLLTQTFLLTKNTTNMRHEADEAKSHLDSYLRIFKDKSKPSNLLPALDLVNNLPVAKDLRSSIRLSWRPLPIPESVKETIQSNPNVFIYRNLLPQVAYSILPEKLMPKKPKMNFTLNEDKLLTYALNEFRGESSPYAFIASLLMTSKTKMQISNHIKNIKRSPGNENNPIKLFYANNELPIIDLDSDSETVGLRLSNESVKEELVEMSENPDDCNVPQDEQIEPKEKSSYSGLEDQCENNPTFFSSDQYQSHDDIMNMNLDDLMAASTTISKSTILNVGNSENNKNIKNLKLKKSMINLMSHTFLLSKDMGDLIIYEFLKASQLKLNERNHLHLLQLLTDLMKREANKEDDQTIVTIYTEISNFLKKINAPPELHERIVLFLNLEQASKCGCSESYLHWMRFFEFMQHIQLYHDSGEAFEKKLIRLIDTLQKDDPHKIKLAIGNLVNKHPFLKREFDSLSLEEKPHPSLFICEEDFDDITEPISSDTTNYEEFSSTYKYEHFSSKLSEEELNYASQACPCKCHSQPTIDGHPTQHCSKCNLKFMKGRMYLVNKIKPILAEWTYTPPKVESLGSTKSASLNGAPAVPDWTMEEDREILEFCRTKAEQNEETISFDTSTFEELVNRKRPPQSDGSGVGGVSCKKSAREIANRFNQLMEMYKDENLNSSQ